MRTFLLQTALLDRLCGPLCDAVTGQSDSDRLLAHLEAANLFVIPLDEDRRWYRYHHLFADLLRSQLARSQPDLIPELHRGASRWFEKNGDIHAAVEHALQASDLTLAAHLIEQHALPKLYQGEVTMVVSWFDRLPEAILQNAPMLCICKAWALALMQRGTRRREVESILHAAQAEELMARLANPARSASNGRAAIGLAAGLRLRSGSLPTPAPCLSSSASRSAWSVSRLRTLVRDAAPGQSERAQVAHLFGKKPAA